MRFLVFGDMHLSYEEDGFRSDYLEEELDLESYDYFVTTGNVMEDVRKFEDDEAQGAIEFYDTLNQWGKDHNIETLAVPGNLDFHMYKPFIHNMSNRWHIRHAADTTFYTHKTGENHESGYVFVAKGADSWDQSPALEPTSYENITPSGSNGKQTNKSIKTEIEEALEPVGWGWPLEPKIKEAGDELGIPLQHRGSFESDALDYRQRFDDVKSVLGGKDQDGSFDVIYLNHAPPFNTDIDDGVSSIADKNAIKNYQPRLAISGHGEEGGEDMIGSLTTALNAGKRQLLEVDITSEDLRFNFLN